MAELDARKTLQDGHKLAMTTWLSSNIAYVKARIELTVLQLAKEET